MTQSISVTRGTLKILGGIAQLGEHLLCKQGVIGSNPFTSTTEEVGGGGARENGLIAQSVRAHA